MMGQDHSMLKFYCMFTRTFSLFYGDVIYLYARRLSLEFCVTNYVVQQEIDTADPRPHLSDYLAYLYLLYTMNTSTWVDTTGYEYH